MSLVKLADGTKFEIETPTGVRSGVLRQRQRNILTLVFSDVTDKKITEIKKAFSNESKTEAITVYFPDEKESATDEQLSPKDGTAPPAHEVYEGFTMQGDKKEEWVINEVGTPDNTATYKLQFSLEMGQRQHGEAE